MRLGSTALLLALVVGCGGPDPVAHRETLLYNGKIFTADFDRPWAEALLVRGDRIVAVGTTDELLAGLAASSEAIDLRGRVVVPGFDDAHDHVTPGFPSEPVATSGGPMPDPTFREVVNSLRAAVTRVPAGTRLVVRVGERVLGDYRARRPALDAVAPNHPVQLRGWSGHGMVVNSAELAAAGIGDTVVDPQGGWFERAGRRLTGRMDEYAMFNLAVAQTPQQVSAVVAAMRARAAEAVAWGTTSIQNMPIGVEPATLAQAVDSLDLPIRVRMIAFPATTAAGREPAPWRAIGTGPSDRIEVSGVKYVLDGTPIERLALHRRPYTDRPGWYGRANFAPDTVRAILQEALASREQPLFHAAGDSAIALVLNAMVDLAPDSVWQRIRVRLEHADGLAPDQFEMVRRLGIVVVQNPSHLALGPMVNARYGPARVRTYQPMRSLLDHGIMLALGSDGPTNPFLNLMFAVSHPDNPAEALTMEQAVRAYTLGSAYAQGKEGVRGRLVIGMMADLAVLSQDIFTIAPQELPATVSLLTLR
ncbi:MAG: amidohydrolase, partial [Gemmatimonadales bacterium]